MKETMTTAAGRHVARRKLVGRAEQRKESWENNKMTLELKRQLKITKKNQSFLPLTAFQVGNKVAGKRPLKWLAEMYKAKGEEKK